MNTMEQLTETIDLDIDECNDLAFKIKLEGAATSPAKVRLVCEGEKFSYMFNGYGTGEEEVVQFTLPQMSSTLHEGTYNARVEVLVENRYFTPLQFQINFKKSVKVVVAEVVQKAPKPAEVKVSSVVRVSTPTPIASSTIKFEQRPQQKIVSEKIEEKTQETITATSSISSLRDSYLKRLQDARSSLQNKHRK